MFGDLLFTVICMAYFAGGLTIGWYAKDWKKKMVKKGYGRCD